MKFNLKLSAIMFTAVFIIVVAGLGTASFIKLVKFYVNDEVDYNEWSADLGSKFETDIATCFYQKFNFINFNGGMRNILGQREMNGVIKLNNGHLMEAYPYVSDEILQQNANGVIALKKYLDEKNIALVYAIAPYASCKYDPQLPEGVVDWGNNNLDRFAEMLKAGGVEPLDFRETMHEDGINQYDMMYRTDHHWNTKAGFYAYLKITERLERSMDCEVDSRIKDISNYTVTTYKKWHLGSWGQRTGAYFAGSDDFDLITPDFETAICRENTEGTYESLIIDMSALQNKNPMSRYTYDLTLNHANADYTNANALNDKKILLMTDSMGKAVNPFLIISYAEFHWMQNGLTSQWIDEYKPAAIVICYYIASMANPEYFKFVL